MTTSNSSCGASSSFPFLAERYERRSVMLSSKLVFSQGDRIFKDAMTSAAAIDRVVHHFVILETTGPSFRAEATERSLQPTTRRPRTHDWMEATGAKVIHGTIPPYRPRRTNAIRREHAEDTEAPMSRTVLIPLRLPPELLEAAEKMLPLVAADPQVAAVGRVTRSSVLRLALAKGLESMQWKYAPKKKAGRGRR